MEGRIFSTFFEKGGGKSTQSYIDLLKDELEDAKQRYQEADDEGQPTVANQIRQIKQDIHRNSMKIEENKR